MLSTPSHGHLLGTWPWGIMRLYSKGRKRLVPLHPTLRNLLVERKNELGMTFVPDDHVIHFIRDTLTTYFRRAFEKAGINKTGAVHILRHTAITKVLNSSRNIRIAQEFAGHSQITTTEIYTHVLQEEMDKAIVNAF
jgi:site-specific recombinase XerD